MNCMKRPSSRIIANALLITASFALWQPPAYPAFNPDSVLNVVSKQPDNREKADNLIALGRHFYFTDMDSSLVFYNLAFNLSQRIGYLPGITDALYMKSKVYMQRADYPAALEYAEQCVDIAGKTSDSVRIARAYIQLSAVQVELNDVDGSLGSSRKSLSYCLPINDTLLIFANYNNLGRVFTRKSQEDSAATYYLKAIHLCELKKDEPNLAVMYDNLGQVYLSDSSFENARSFFLKSLEINRRLGKNAKIAVNLTNLGRLASAESDLKGAIAYYDQVAEIYQNLTDSKGLANLYNNYGDAYFKKKDYSLALKYFDMAISGYTEIGDIRGLICAIGNKASVYSDNGRFDQAIQLTDSCLRMSYREGIVEFRLSYLKNMSGTYFKAGDYRNAFEYQSRYYTLKDSLYSIAETKTVTDLTLKYEKEKDQARILTLEKENLKRTNQRNATMFSAIGLSLLVLFVMLFLRQRAVKDRIIAEQKVKQLEEEKKLMAARFLVEGQEEERKRIARELHDGLGVLLSATKMQFTTIKDKSPENRPLIEKATQLLEQATGDVRKISHNMMPGLLTKLGFFEAVEDLFDNLNDAEDLVAECIINGEAERLPENKEIMLYRVIQEMVNNTLKHAEARNIRLQIDIHPDHLDISYSDDGKGFDIGKKMESDTESIGLKSIQSRVNFLNGSLAMDSAPGSGVHYTMTIPKDF